MRLHVIDGTYELFRAFYARSPERFTPEGRPAKAVVGLISSLLSLLDDPAEAVTHIAVAFDNPIESFRNALLAGYKTGEGMDPDLVAQMGPVEEAVRALGVVVWSMDRWEADDAMATAAARYASQVDEVRLCTPDKDLAQCLRGESVVRLDRRSGVVLTEAGLRERLGIGPESVPDLLALTGDAADGIPGIRGFGDKTARALLGRYVHLEDIPEDAGAWEVPVRGAGRLARTLATERDAALLYRKLATLVTDVPLSEALEDLRWRGVPQKPFLGWCEAAGVGALAARPKVWAPPLAGG